jgi:rod shape-determining protein MreC
MTKNKILFILIIVFAILVTMKVVPTFRGEVLRFSNGIKLTFIQFIDSIKHTVEIHTKQSQRIEELEKKIKELEPSSLLSATLAIRLNKVLKETNLNYHHPSLHLVRTLSFERLGDYNALWLDFKDFDPTKIYGLIYKGYTAGIVREKNGSPLALLELDPTVSLSVYIGKYKTEGVIFGNNKNMVIKYIQKFNILRVGDEVVTSGKDGIFYEGVKIGKVVKITERELYNEAIVEPYIKPTDARYFYAIDTKVERNPER